MNALHVQRIGDTFTFIGRPGGADSEYILLSDAVAQVLACLTTDLLDQARFLKRVQTKTGERVGWLTITVTFQDSVLSLMGDPDLQLVEIRKVDRGIAPAAQVLRLKLIETGDLLAWANNRMREEGLYGDYVTQ